MVQPADTNEYKDFTWADGTTTTFMKIPDASRGVATQLCMMWTGPMLHIRDENAKDPQSLCGRYAYPIVDVDRDGNKSRTLKLIICKSCLRKLK